MNFRTFIRGGVVLTLIASAAVSAKADEVVVTTVACERVPLGTAFVLTPADDSPLNIETADHLAMALRHAGYRIADSAALELQFEMKERGLRGQAMDRTVGRLRIGGGGNVALNLKLWSNTKDSILGGRQPRRPGRYETHLILAMELERSADGSCVWRGEARASLVDWQHSELAERLTRALVDAFGKDVPLRRLRLE